MAYKIHKRGAFVIIENTVNGELKELNSQFVQITKGKTSLDQYEVLYNGVSQLKAVLGDIQDANGVAYVESAWDIFRYEQCGSVNSSEVANPYPAPTTATVDISSAQILAMGTTPIELLPAAGAGKYYEIEKVRFEYTHNTTNYTITDDTPGIIITDSLGYASKAIDQYFFGYENTYIVWDGEFETFNNQIPNTAGISMSMRPLNSDLILSLPAGATIADGDGTLRVIITYTTRTFGA